MAEHKKPDNRFKGMGGLIFIPFYLSMVDQAFTDLYLFAAGGGQYSGLAANPARKLLLSGRFLSLLVMFALLFYWTRPFFRFESTGDRKLIPVLRRRVSNFYRDLLVFFGAAVSSSIILLAVRGAFTTGGISPLSLLLSLLISSAAQLSIMLVQADNLVMKSGKFMEQLYPAEEIYARRSGFTIPLYMKLSMLVGVCGILPLVMLNIAAFRFYEKTMFAEVMPNITLICGVTLLAGLGFISGAIQKPMDALIDRMRRVAAGELDVKSRVYFSDEVGRLKYGFNRMLDGLKEREERLEETAGRMSALESELAVSKATADLAAQVAHDIRSPLAALGAAAKGLALPDEQRRLIGDSVGRMQGIADDLLRRYGAQAAQPAANALRVCPLAGLAAQVVEEKRLQYKDRSGVIIAFDPGAEGIRAAVDPKEFQRLLSNLVNNSVEALEKGGTVSVALRAQDGRAVLQVKDDGSGIPPEILAKLGKKGATYGKAGGTGLGLYHARAAAEAWGGELGIWSESGTGTAVTVTLPSAGEEVFDGRRLAVLLDDDLLVHMNWKMAARAAGVELKAFKRPEELYSALAGLSRDTPLYIDADLGGGVHGETIAADLKEKGFSNISMATGHGPGRFSRLSWLKVTGKEPPFGVKRRS